MEKLTKRIYEFCVSSGYRLHKNNVELKLEYDTIVNKAITSIIDSEQKILQSLEKKESNRKNIGLTIQTDNFIFEYNIDKYLKTQIRIKKYSQIIANLDSQLITGKLNFGYVYFLESEFGYKIGCSGSLKSRIKHFSVKLPFKVFLVSKIKCKNWKEHESNIHTLLKSKKIQGEWYKLDEEDFIIIDKYCAENNIFRVLVETKPEIY